MLTKGRQPWEARWVWHIPKSPHCELAAIAELWLSPVGSMVARYLGIFHQTLLFSLSTHNSFSALFSVGFKLQKFQVVKIFKKI